MLTTESLASLRAALEEERTRLRSQIEGGPGEGDFDENFADSAQVAAEQGEQRVLTDSFEDQLADVEAALAKVDDGTYGQCEADGEPIAPARLEAFPAARRCIEHS